MVESPSPIRTAVEGAINDARCEVTGGNGHYAIVVTSPTFAGLNMIAIAVDGW